MVFVSFLLPSSGQNAGMTIMFCIFRFVLYVYARPLYNIQTAKWDKGRNVKYMNVFLVQIAITKFCSGAIKVSF